MDNNVENTRLNTLSEFILHNILQNHGDTEGIFILKATLKLKENKLTEQVEFPLSLFFSVFLGIAEKDILLFTSQFCLKLGC